MKEFDSCLKTSIADVDKILESSIATGSLTQNESGPVWYSFDKKSQQITISEKLIQSCLLITEDNSINYTTLEDLLKHFLTAKQCNAVK